MRCRDAGVGSVQVLYSQYQERDIKWFFRTTLVERPKREFLCTEHPSGLVNIAEAFHQQEIVRSCMLTLSLTSLRWKSLMVSLLVAPVYLVTTKRSYPCSITSGPRSRSAELTPSRLP